MPLIPTRKCARHGSLEAKRIRICMFEVHDDNGTEVELGSRTFKPVTFEEDLSVRAISELLVTIQRGIKPPVKRPPKKGGGDGK